MRSEGMGFWQKTARDLRFVGGVLRRKPFHVLVQVTNRCNMQCSFCDFWSNGVAPRFELKPDDYVRIADELAQLGCFLVSIEGGEPTLRRDLVDIVQAFARHHVPVLYTNGWYIDAPKAKALFDAGLAQVGVSIDFDNDEQHDRKRGLQGATQRAWQAVDFFREAAPHAGNQVHVMTILMQENRQQWESLLQQSAAHQVGHCFTLLSTGGFRRGRNQNDQLPDGELTNTLLSLWQRYPHMRSFRDYLQRMDDHLAGRDVMPTCHAGEQSFNIDHVGNVSPCIERIDQIAGNVRESSLKTILPRMHGNDEVAQCQQCWTLCRGFAQALGEGSRVQSLLDLTLRMRS